MEKGTFLKTIKCSNCGQFVHNVLVKKINGLTYIRAPALNGSDYLTVMSAKGECGVVHCDCPKT